MVNIEFIGITVVVKNEDGSRTTHNAPLGITSFTKAKEYLTQTEQNLGLVRKVPVTNGTEGAGTATPGNNA